MTKNPLINALAALLYIILVAAVMFFGEKMAGPVNTFIAPVAVLSLFTLSAAVMGYLFCYQPGQLYFDGNRKEGINLFLSTVVIFGVITVIMLLLLFSGVLRQKKRAAPAGTIPPASIPTVLPTSIPAAGIANPAAVYCVNEGGKSAIVTAADGSQSGLCVFTDGRKCDEWTFFRTKICR